MKRKIEIKQEWVDVVARTLKCSKPTARQYLRQTIDFMVEEEFRLTARDIVDYAIEFNMQ